MQQLVYAPYSKKKFDEQNNFTSEIRKTEDVTCVTVCKVTWVTV